MRKILFGAMVSLLTIGISGCGPESSHKDHGGNFSPEPKIKPGQEIYFYDEETGEYGNGNVQSVRRVGSRLEVRLHHYESGRYKTIRMSDK